MTRGRRGKVLFAHTPKAAGLHPNSVPPLAPNRVFLTP